MKKFAVFVIIIFLFTCSLFGTYTRVNSLGDIANPVSGEISYLIKDDIVDIYFNPAKVNDVKAFIILSSFNLQNGSDQNEKENTFKIVNGIISTTNVTSSKITAYNFKTKTGILIPLKSINLFINYSPEWNRVKEEISFDSDISTATNQIIKNFSDRNIMRQLDFDITLGFNLFDKIKTGIRVGTFNEKYNEYSINTDGEESKKGNYIKNKFLVGAGIEFSFIKNIDISLAGDISVNTKDESPLKIEDGFENSGNYNYNTTYNVFTYSFLENEYKYNLRIIPELKLKNKDFFRFLAEVSFYNYSKDYTFNPKLSLKDYKIDYFNKNKIILNAGIGFNNSLRKSIKGIYGIKYSGLIKGINQYKFYTDKNDPTSYNEFKEETKDNYVGIFTGFDIQVTKIIYIRTGISQGLWRYYEYSSIDEVTKRTVSRTITYYMPETIFTLGFYIMPINDLTIEFNFSNNKDWDASNITTEKMRIIDNGKTTETQDAENYDFNLGLTVSYKF